MPTTVRPPPLLHGRKHLDQCPARSFAHSDGAARSTGRPNPRSNRTGRRATFSGDLAIAIATLNSALEAGPDARAFYLRARARELAGQTDASLADYNLAARAAFASAVNCPVGGSPVPRHSALPAQGFRARGRRVCELSQPGYTGSAPAGRFRLAASLRRGCGLLRRRAGILKQSLHAASPFFPKKRPRRWRQGVLQCRVRWHQKASTRSF